MSHVPITVRESPLFSRWADETWTPEERFSFIDFIARNPMAGDIIAGTGGFRKVRWSARGRGKRGGTRIITYFLHASCPLYLALGYAKNESDTLTEAQKSVLRMTAAAIKREGRTFKS